MKKKTNHDPESKLITIKKVSFNSIKWRIYYRFFFCFKILIFQYFFIEVFKMLSKSQIYLKFAKFLRFRKNFVSKFSKRPSFSAPWTILRFPRQFANPKSLLPLTRTCIMKTRKKIKNYIRSHETRNLII